MWRLLAAIDHTSSTGRTQVTKWHIVILPLATLRHSWNSMVSTDVDLAHAAELFSLWRIRRSPYVKIHYYSSVMLWPVVMMAADALLSRQTTPDAAFLG